MGPALLPNRGFAGVAAIRTSAAAVRRSPRPGGYSVSHRSRSTIRFQSRLETSAFRSQERPHFGPVSLFIAADEFIAPGSRHECCDRCEQIHSPLEWEAYFQSN